MAWLGLAWTQPPQACAPCDGRASQQPHFMRVLLWSGRSQSSDHGYGAGSVYCGEGHCTTLQMRVIGIKTGLWDHHQSIPHKKLALGTMWELFLPHQVLGWARLSFHVSATFLSVSFAPQHHNFRETFAKLSRRSCKFSPARSTRR